jgi:hypothetical protein
MDEKRARRDCVSRQSARRNRSLAVALLTLAASGCMTAKVDETRRAVAHVQPNESIVLLKRPKVEGNGTEEVFLDCVQEHLGGELIHPEEGQKARKFADAQVPFRIYGEQQFADQMFPWFEPSTAPLNANGLHVLLQRPGVSERLRQIGVRYVVWVDGNTRKTDGGGSIACGAGPGGAGCIGLGWWEKNSGYVASVWDVQEGTEIGSVETDVTGTSVLIGAIAPIPIITPVRRTACDRLSEQLRSFLQGTDVAGGAPAVTSRPTSAVGTGKGSR